MSTFYDSVKTVLRNAQTTAYRAVNITMVEAYWKIGKLIVEEEQQGNSRAEYGAGLLKYLAQRLTEDFGKGFDQRDMRRIWQFFQSFPIRDAVRPELTWTHYQLLIKVDNPDAQVWYMKEAAEQHWSRRALDRRIGTFYYERLLATNEANRPGVREEADQNTKPLQLSPKNVYTQPGDTPTIGLSLCTEKNETVVNYSVLTGSQQLFASKYKLFLPSEEELKAEIEREQFLIEQSRLTS